MEQESFEFCCQIADLNPGWCRELVSSIFKLPESVRKQITAACLHMIEHGEMSENVDRTLSMSAAPMPHLELELRPTHVKLMDFDGTTRPSSLRERRERQIAKAALPKPKWSELLPSPKGWSRVGE